MTSPQSMHWTCRPAAGYGPETRGRSTWPRVADRCNRRFRFQRRIEPTEPIDSKPTSCNCSRAQAGGFETMTTNDQAHRIYQKWDEYARSGEVDGLLALYAPDGIFESPLVPVVMKRESGVCRGHHEIR